MGSKLNSRLIYFFGEGRRQDYRPSPKKLHQSQEKILPANQNEARSPWNPKEIFFDPPPPLPPL